MLEPLISTKQFSKDFLDIEGLAELMRHRKGLNYRNGSERGHYQVGYLYKVLRGAVEPTKVLDIPPTFFKRTSGAKAIYLWFKPEVEAYLDGRTFTVDRSPKNIQWLYRSSVTTREAQKIVPRWQSTSRLLHYLEEAGLRPLALIDGIGAVWRTCEIEKLKNYLSNELIVPLNEKAINFLDSKSTFEIENWVNLDWFQFMLPESSWITQYVLNHYHRALYVEAPALNEDSEVADRFYYEEIDGLECAFLEAISNLAIYGTCCEPDKNGELLSCPPAQENKLQNKYVYKTGFSYLIQVPPEYYCYNCNAFWWPKLHDPNRYEIN